MGWSQRHSSGVEPCCRPICSSAARPTTTRRASRSRRARGTSPIAGRAREIRSCGTGSRSRRPRTSRSRTSRELPSGDARWWAPSSHIASSRALRCSRFRSRPRATSRTRGPTHLQRSRSQSRTGTSLAFLMGPRSPTASSPKRSRSHRHRRPRLGSAIGASVSCGTSSRTSRASSRCGHLVPSTR